MEEDLSRYFPPEAAAAGWSQVVLALRNAPAASFHRVNFPSERFAFVTLEK